MDTRALARRYVPRRLLLGRKLTLQRLADLRAGVRFAGKDRRSAGYEFEWSRYERPFIDYPGQEHLGRAKRLNQALLASYLDGVVVRPDEVFSVWKLAPSPSSRNGFSSAAALREGKLTSEPGGAICLLSTVLYNAGLLAAFDVVERHCHSVDSYGDGRYFELGRDAAIEYGYLDLRLRNPHAYPLAIHLDVSESRVVAWTTAPVPMAFGVEFRIGEVEELPALPGDRRRFRVHTTRIVRTPVSTREDDLGWSTYREP